MLPHGQERWFIHCPKSGRATLSLTDGNPLQVEPIVLLNVLTTGYSYDRVLDLDRQIEKTGIGVPARL